MRKVLAAVFTSLDGVMQAPGGPEEDPTGGFPFGGWGTRHWDESMGDSMGALFSDPFDLLLGRRTFDIFAAHWPFAKDDPIGDAFNACTKYVASRTGTMLPWANTVSLGGDAGDAVARLKAEDGPLLLVQGSSDLLQTLLARGLVDEIRLMIFPVVLGSGKRLFGSGTAPLGLTLDGHAVSTTGVVTLTYRPAGPVELGSFALETPTDEEVERRRRLAAED